ncbi:hypothetical protein CC1G_03256 [Coprinopsis cinerea okayama7|uniref:Vacuolar sorting protein Vps3844 C-terminal domain-containing protein n=1 Tax=Coprinopsis cinerea (strain Okayama-7 / 130 / ATCC MYA-4618 / FGSC 9003) TaxID=240176 RepID=A8N7B3_COPC7|nr:hypothetical protein CC1G_03256 [Coprinopsis cinerea okayama7\|eukprot:XP_001830719.1 hypothetical protein CC1G_03256 [Coprinopsis cinerea okayama7\
MLPHILVGLVLSASVQVAQAVNIYLYPARDYAVGVNSLEAASAAVSRHLGLERFEDAPNALTVAEDFVGAGVKDGVLLTLTEDDANAVLSSDFKASSTIEQVPTPNNIDSLASVVSTYLHRARHAYSNLFSPRESWRLDDVDDLADFFHSTTGPAFAAVEVSKLQDLRQKYGSTSNEYRAFASKLREFLENAVQNKPHFNVAILTFQSSSSVKRSPNPQQSPFPDHPLPQEPIGAISTCFADVDTCNEKTSSCSSRGQCVKATKSGRTCYVCACGVTKTGKGDKVKTDRWVGESCERKDVSGPFVLLTGTTIVLLLVVFGSITLLYSIGDQSLPSILLATAVTSKRD